MITKKKKTNIAKLCMVAILTVLGTGFALGQSKTIDVNSFDEVIISPHLEVVFKKGNKESVTINELKVPMDKLNLEVKRNTLHVYLEGAKITTKTKKVMVDGSMRKVPIYKGTQGKLVVTYTDVETFSLRGEEKFVFDSALEKDKMKFNIYGESQIQVKEAQINELRVAIHGESSFEINKGNIKKQRFTAYGESTVNTLGVSNETTKITAYGDGEYKFNISERLKVTSYGESNIAYKGSGEVKKGLVIGDTTIEMIE